MKLAILRAHSKTPQNKNLHIVQQSIEHNIESSASLVELDDEDEIIQEQQSNKFIIYFWDQENNVIAFRITCIEFNMFKAITGDIILINYILQLKVMFLVRELLNLNWRNGKSETPSIAVIEMISRFNNVSFWVLYNILKIKDIEKRVQIIEKTINLADILYEMKNYNTLMEIISGLNQHAVQRLKKTWEVNDLNIFIHILKIKYRNYHLGHKKHLLN